MRSHELCLKLLDKVEENAKDLKNTELAQSLRNFASRLRDGLPLLKEAHESRDEVEPGLDKTMECIGLLNAKYGCRLMVDDYEDDSEDEKVIWLYERQHLPTVYSFLDYLDLAYFLEPFAYGDQTLREFRRALNAAPSALTKRYNHLLQQTEV